MNVQKFTAPTSREALRKVRDALGPDAVILSNRPVDGLIEILALANEDAAASAAPAAHSEMAQPRPNLQFPPQETPRAPAAERQIDVNAAVQAAVAQAKASAAAEMQGMMNELRAMRGMMETQLAELSWNATQQREPHKATVLRDLLAAGFSASLARYLIERLPAGKDAADSLRWMKNVLARNLNVMQNEDAILDRGGVFALVGPTGVGKTTSTAKLAARCVMRHGADKLALITTDGYRIGAHEQLRIYGKILGVMVHSVKDEADLRIALKELRNKHTVLIDTVGVSQRDHMVSEQVAMLNGAGTNVQRLLCLNATSTADTLNEVVRAYHGHNLAGCIMTKLDEAAAIGSVLDVVIRQKLTMFYVSNGQRVPEDLHLADRQSLIEHAFQLKADAAPTLFNDAELPAVMAGAQADRSLREVYLG